MTAAPEALCGHPLTYRMDQPPSPADCLVLCPACAARKVDRFYMDHAGDLLEGIPVGPANPDQYGDAHRLMLSARRLAGQAWALVARSIVPAEGGGFATDAERADARRLAQDLAALAWELHGRALALTDAADALAADLAAVARRLRLITARLARGVTWPERRCVRRAISPPSRRSLPAHQSAQAPPCWRWCSLYGVIPDVS